MYNKITIYDLSFGQYVNLVLGDYSVLGIQEATPDVLETERSVIMSEFASLTGDITYISDMTAKYKQMKLNLKLLGLSLGQKVLQVNYHPDTLEYLKEIKVIPKNTQYPTTQSELQRILDRIDVEIGRTRIDIDEIEALNPLENGQQNTATDKGAFTKLLAAVSMFVKFSVTWETNAAVVAHYVNSMRAQTEKI